MLAGSITPHPDFPESYVLMKGPPSMGEDCGDLACRIVLADGKYPGFLAEWIPTERERELIAAGQPVRVLILGNGLPPSSVWVKEVEEV